jgi:Bacteriophytochrome (light-regulated signal transduction histidine kinase)
MTDVNRLQAGKHRVHFPRLSIQHRLTLLICALLLVVIIAVTWVSYIGMKNSAMEAGTSRLLTLSEQLSTMFQQSARQARATMRTAASNEVFLKTLFNNANGNSKDSGLAQLIKLQTDTSVVAVELINLNRQPILSVAGTNAHRSLNIEQELRATSAQPEFTTVGKIVPVGDSMYYPIIVAVTDKANKPIGHIVQWRTVRTTERALGQLSAIIGSDATLYIGNNDGKFWTNLLSPVALPAFNKTKTADVVTYKRDGNRMYASVRPIVNTNWMVMVEFPEKAILSPASEFLYWMIGAGVIVLLVSILFAWTMSRNITRPLQELTSAASSIASGNLSASVPVDRYDELGKLARAFNAMSVQIQNAHRDLEKKVADRTERLEAVNKELEAFSYSVSHDLRAPLRAVSGYAQILQEDYGTQLDAEANRILNAIMNNAHMMGQLIDDLITFSRISRKEVTHQPINMRQLAETCLHEIQESNGKIKYNVRIHDLPPCEGDQSMIKQVWMNLISNAVKYSSREALPAIEIGYKEKENEHVYFVKDNGVGFDMQYAHKLFGVFQRLHSSEAFEGTGVGLALTKRIINKHAGDIWAESAPGEGATFYISLPKNKDE